MSASGERIVLCFLAEHTRAVRLSQGTATTRELKEAIYTEFSNVLETDTRTLFLKRKDELM